MKITRKIASDNRNGYRKVAKVLRVEVKPGWKAGTKIRFECEGDQNVGTIPADIVFVIRDTPHPQFARDGADIVYTAKISAKDLSLGCTVNVPTLTGETLALWFTKKDVTQSTVRKIPGHGLPYPKHPTRRGDLYIKFVIEKCSPEDWNRSPLKRRFDIDGESEADAPERDRIKVNVLAANFESESIDFSLKMSARFGKLKKRYSERVGVQLWTLTFRFNGRRIRDRDTPERLDMEDNDIVAVYQEF